MTIADPLAADDEKGYALALVLKSSLIEEYPQPDASVILHAACWLLADVIIQAEAIKGVDTERAMALVVVKLASAVDRLRRANADATPPTRPVH